MPNVKSISQLGALLILAMCAPAFSQQAQPQPARIVRGDATAVVTRVYDISDLISAKQDYPAPDEFSSARSGRTGGGGGGNLFGGSQPATNPQTGDERAEMVMRLIKDTISPETWRDTGDNRLALGVIRSLDQQLIVSQTVANQTQIISLLAELRQQQSSIVAVHAYWLLLDPEVAASIHGADGALAVVDDKLIDAKHLYSAAQAICLNGQTIHLSAGHRRNVVKDVTPVVASNAIGYDPTVEQARSGAVLQVTPRLIQAQDGQDTGVMLDLHSRVTEMIDPESRIESQNSPAPAGVATSSYGIDRANQISQEFQMTARLPLRKKILVGGMTLEPSTKDLGSQQLYLVIEADAVK